MARKAVVILEDDLSGEQLEASRGETVSFALDGNNYEIDLSGEHATELRQALRRFTEAARKTGATTRRDAGRQTVQRRTDTAAIRTWAREHGHQVPDRGRIPNAVLAAYAAAH